MKAYILGIALLFLMPSIVGIVSENGEAAANQTPSGKSPSGTVDFSTAPLGINEIAESVVPNISVPYPFYDVYATPDNRLVHSLCQPIPVGISYGRTMWFRDNWCHQVRGVI